MKEGEKMAVKQREMLWWVRAEGFPKVPVIATNWEQATVEAAHLWGVPWGKVAARCELVDKTYVVKNVCIFCKRIFNGEGVICERCRHAQETDAKNAEPLARRYFARMNRKDA